MRTTGPLVFAIAMLAAGVCAPVAAVECDRPAPPHLPKRGAIAQSELRNARDDVEHYAYAVNTYLSCLEEEKLAARDEAERIIDEMNRLIERHNRKP